MAKQTQTQNKLAYNPVLVREIIEGRLGFDLGDCQRKFGGSRAFYSMLKKGTYGSSPGKPVGKSKQLMKFIDGLKDMGIHDADDILKPMPKSRQKKQVNKEKEVKVMDMRSLKFWGFKTNPFDNDEFEDQLWVNDEVENVKETMRYFAVNKKFLIVAGDVGTGKSTLLELLYEELIDRESIKVYKPSPLLTEKIESGWLVNEIIEKEGKTLPFRIKTRTELAGNIINQHKQNKKTLLFLIDEAHRLPDETWRSLKRFWEGKGAHKFHIGIILVGQLPVLKVLADDELEEVRERSKTIYLKPFHKLIKDKWIIQVDAIRGYIKFKLNLVNADDKIFTPEAVQAIAARCTTPLNVNNLCTNALVVAAQTGTTEITAEVIDAS